MATAGNLVKVNAASPLSFTDSGIAASDVARLSAVGAFTKQQYAAQATLTDAATIAWNLDNAQAARVVLGDNRTLANPTNMHAGATYTLIVVQDGTGGRTLAYGNKYMWPGGTAPVLSTGIDAIDILTFISDGTNMYGAAQLDFS